MSAIFDYSSFPTMTTRRLYMRPMNYGDADAIMALFGSPEVLRFLNQPPTDTLEKSLKLIDWLNELFEKKQSVQWGIILCDNDQFIGTCGYYGWNRENRHVDIGYHIVPSHWGRGYATEACLAVVNWCFENLNVHRVQADCTDGHFASERVLLKCGFKVEGIWRESCWEHGRFVDIKQFGLLRREYEGRTAETQ